MPIITLVLLSLLATPQDSQDFRRGHCREGQTPTYSLTGIDTGENFGWQVLHIGDVDDDGVQDAMILAPNYGQDHGRVSLHSGRDGSYLYSIRGTTPNALFGNYAARAGDLDDDGTEDFLIGAHGTGTGRVYLYSGASGIDDPPPMHVFNGTQVGEDFGYMVAGGGDYDNDGIMDIAIGAPEFRSGGRRGRVEIYSGESFERISEIQGEPGDRLGTALSFLNDVNGDQRAEVIAGSSGTFVAQVFSFDGVNSQRLYGVPIERRGSGYFFASSRGDTNGDGFDDFILGVGTTRTCYLCSGKDGQVLHLFSAGRNSFGISEMVDDVDGDGVADVLVYDDANGERGRVIVYSCRTGKIIQTLSWSGEKHAFGSDVGSLGDIDGDGTVDLIIAANGSGQPVGTVFVLPFRGKNKLR